MLWPVALRILLLPAVAGVGLALSCNLAQAAGVSLTVSELAAMGKQQQRMLLKASLQWRHEEQANIEFEAESRFYQVSLPGVSVADLDKAMPLGETTSMKIHQRRIGDSYLSEQFSSTSQRAGDYQLYCRNHYNSSKSYNKGFVRTEGKYQGNGRLSTQQDGIEERNRLNLLFSMGKSRYGRSLFRELQEMLEASETVINLTDNMLTLTCVQATPGASGKERRRFASFLPEQQFVPLVYISYFWDADGQITMYDAMRCMDSLDVDGLFFPSRFVCVRGPRVGATTKPLGVYDFRISDIRRGHLEDSDLDFEFPPETLVVDATTNRAYVDLGDGRRQELEPPIDFQTGDISTNENRSPEKPKTFPWRLLVINGVVLVAVLIYYTRRRDA